MRTLSPPLALFALFIAGAAAQAGETVHATTMAALPEPVRALLERRHGEIGDAGAPFSQWCERAPGTFHARLITAEVQDDAVRVRFERGGISGARPQDAQFRRTSDTWTEVGQPDLPPPQVAWTGRPREFTQVTDKILPPLWKPSDASMK